jgi:hypothetical protein
MTESKPSLPQAVAKFGPEAAAAFASGWIESG